MSKARIWPQMEFYKRLANELLYIIMPILWRYLIKQYCKTFFLSLATLLFLLFAFRLDEITHFISQDATRSALLAFIAHQIPFLLPIALPLSALIAAYIVAKEMSSRHEISALRSLGLTFSSLFFPLFAFSFVLGLANFVLTSEMATHSHLQSTLLKNELKQINPLLLLHNKRILQTKGIVFDNLGNSKMGKWAEGIVIGLAGKENERIKLLIAKKVAQEEAGFYGYGLTLIHPLDDNEQDSSLIVENIQSMRFDTEEIAPLLQRSTFKEQEDHLPLASLLHKIHLGQDNKEWVKALSEIVRRAILGMAPILFTLLGLSFGTRIGRTETLWPLIAMTILVAFFLATFFVAKGLSDKLEATVCLYILPSLLILGGTIVRFRLLNRGRIST
jgi:lipopolysaccharide export system permease protein